MVRISVAAVPEVDRVWPLVASGLDRSCHRTGGDLTSHYLWTECRAGRAFLAVVAEGQDVLGASVWRFEDWSSGRKLRCVGLYGRRMKDWLADHHRMAIEMARVGGATALVTEGRKGWQRLFPDAHLLRQVYELRLG